MSLFELKEDTKVLFKIEGNKIVDYDVIPFINDIKKVKGFEISWVGSKGVGSFTYYDYYDDDVQTLDTEFMGKEFCIKFMKEIFNCCEVEYNES